MQEIQQFQAWKLGMSKNLVPTQSQAQAQSIVDLTGPQGETDFSGEVIQKPRRWTSVKCSKSQDRTGQVQPVPKHARSTASASQRPLSPRGDYPRVPSANSESKGHPSQDQAPAISRDPDFESEQDQADQLHPPV